MNLTAIITISAVLIAAVILLILFSLMKSASILDNSNPKYRMMDFETIACKEYKNKKKGSKYDKSKKRLKPRY